MNNWIKVTERLPEPIGKVLVYEPPRYGTPYMPISLYLADMVIYCSPNCSWMSLPPAPTQEG